MLRELRLTLGTEDVQTRIFNWKLVDAQLKNSIRIFNWKLVDAQLKNSM